MRFLPGKVVPLTEIVGLERPVAAPEHSLRLPLKQERQRPSRGADIDRLPQAIQDEHMLIQHGAHIQLTREKLHKSPGPVNAPGSVEPVPGSNHLPNLRTSGYDISL